MSKKLNEDGLRILWNKIVTGVEYITGKVNVVTDGTLQSQISNLKSEIVKYYKKPSSGIPKTDLTTEVQQLLTKAGTALQSHQDISGKLNTSLKGTANGLAELDSNGKVPSSQLPSYVDDVIEGYLYNSKFYKESAHTTVITGESGKIYIDISTAKTYRWSGSAFVVISETLALGETSSTAYRGDRGKTAYEHSQATHARTDATKVEASTTNGKIKINGTDTTVYTHPSGTNPHGTTKSDVGLSNVGNFKAVSTVANQGLTDAEKTNARTNIGAGTPVSGMKGASSSAAGTAGLVPAPAAGNQGKFLRGDGTWQSVITSLSGYVKFTDISASLAENAKSLVVSNSAITANSKIEVFTSVFGVDPTNINAVAGKVTLTFPATHAAATIIVRVS